MSQYAYDKWLTTTPADSAHVEECECPKCHDWHVEDGQVVENAKSPDFQCCRDQLEADIHNGKRCPKHPGQFIGIKRDPKWCDECREEK